jgi:serine/threonine-protein kinase
MNAERWNQVQTLFKELVTLNEQDRESRLNILREEDSELFHEVRSLLAADADQTSILDGFVVDSIDVSDLLSLKGTRIGPFVIDHRIGSGGMGSVYMAKRAEGGFEQKVALKLIKEGIDSEHILERFEGERSILARLEHANIARLVDGGLTQEARPWFAMEFVQGQAIDDYAEARTLSIKERLLLFKRVNSAVQYAHQNLIIHRDLKPDNILVSGPPKSPQIKLLDFGIAQILDDVENQLKGSSGLTMAYASPEQRKGELTSTLTDIYSLGVVLYELLAGCHPIKKYRRQKAAPREVPVELLSICNKAMSEEPESRFETVADLNSEIANWENERPVDSHSKKRRYVFKKFVKRNRTPVSMAILSVIAIVLVALFYTSELKKEKEIAQQEAARSARIASVLGNSLRLVDPTETSATELTAKALLDNSLSYIGDELDEDPKVQSSLYATMADVYASLGLFDTADSVSVLSYSNYLAAADTQDVEYINTLSQRSDILLQGGKFKEAGQFIERAVLLANKNMEPNTIEYADVLYNWNNYLYQQANYSQADSVLKIIKPIYEKNRDDYESYYQDVIFYLGTNYRKMGMYDSAEVYLKKALDLSRETYEEPNEFIASNLNHLSSLYQNMGEPNKALPFAIDSYEQRREVFGEDHINTIASQANTARTYGGVGNYEKSAALYESVIEKFKRLYGEDNFNLAALSQSLGNTYLRMDEFEKAEANMRKSLEISERLLPEDNIRQAYPLQGMADIFKKKGEFNQALPYVRRALEIRESILGDDDPLVAQSRYTVGICLWNLNEKDEAKKLLLKAKGVFETNSERFSDQLQEIEGLGLD